MKKPKNTRKKKAKAKAAPQYAEFNINGFVKVRLTQFGRDCLRKNYNSLAHSYGGKLPFAFEVPKEDTEGFSQWQMHDLMRAFGPYMGCCTLPVPFDTTIRINQDELILF